MSLSPIRNFHLIRHFSWQHLTSRDLKAHDHQVSIPFSSAQVGGWQGNGDTEQAREGEAEERMCCVSLSFQKSPGADISHLSWLSRGQGSLVTTPFLFVIEGKGSDQNLGVSGKHFGATAMG